MWRSAAAGAVLLLALVTATGAQRPPCRREDGGTVCTTISSSIFVLNRTATWPEAHELCRRRDMFLFTSERKTDVIIEYFRSTELEQFERFWVGAKYLRNGYYHYVFPAWRTDGEMYYSELGTSPGSDPSEMCLLLVLASEEPTDWVSCQSRQNVICLADADTAAETAPAGYRPSLSVLANGELFQPAVAGDAVLTLEPARLGGLNLSIRCGDGDSVVKDHFVIGGTEYRSGWWLSNFTAVQQLLPAREGNPLDVGTFWCQRYVEGTAEPVTSGRFHVTTSKDMLLLRGSRSRVLSQFQELLFFGDVEGSGLEPAQEGQGRPGLAAELLRLAESEGVPAELDYLALYEFPGEARQRSRSPQRQSVNGSTPAVTTTASQTVALLVSVSGTVSGLGDATSVLKVFSCREEAAGGHVWRSRNSSDFAASEPECVVAGGAARVERRCVPSFERGAAWGPFCAAGRCQQDLPQCRTPRSACPAGFHVWSRRFCAVWAGDVTHDEREEACRRRHPRAFAWDEGYDGYYPDQSTVGTPTGWMTSRRLWRHGPFWPMLAVPFPRLESLSGLDCAVAETLPNSLLVRSVACDERHPVLCLVLRPDDTVRDVLLPCGTLPDSGRLNAEPERCLSLLCSERALPWSEAAARCAGHGASLASLASWWNSATVLQVAAAGGVQYRLAAVDLERRGDAVRWGDGAPLTYPALAPDLSAAREHTRGVLRLRTRHFDFAGDGEPVAQCAVCEQTVSTAAPELHLFRAEVDDEPSILLNVTVPFVNPANGARSDALRGIRCFVSTRQHNDDLSFTANTRALPGGNDGDVNGDISIFNVFPLVNFGYLVCVFHTFPPYGKIFSNKLVLGEGTSPYQDDGEQEYVVGLRQPPGESEANATDASNCDLTFCVIGKCRCFTQPEGYVRFQSTYTMRLRPMRIEERDDGRLVEFYHATVYPYTFSRRRRQAESEPTDGAQLLRRQFGSALEYLRPARCCPSERTARPAPLSWPRTCGGAAVPSELCLGAAGRPALRRCTGDPLSGVQWGPVELAGDACAAVTSRTTLDLHRLANTPVTAATSANMTAELVHLTRRPAELVAQDVISATMTLENVERALRRQPAPTAAEARAVRQHVVTAVSHLADVDGSSLAAASESVSAGPRAVRALERILTTMPVRDDSDVTSDNVAVRSGRLFGATSASPDIREGSVRLVNTSADRSVLFGVEAALLLADGQPADGGLFLVLRDGRLLHSAGQRVTSQVLSLLVPDRPEVENVRRRVLLAFRSSGRQCAPAPTCAFWDWDAAAWSTRGCWLQEVANGSDVCVCNHLTNFARIFNYEPDVYLSDWHHWLLDVITYVGCALSLLGLVLTVATFVLFKKWRRPRGNQIVLHLSVALLGVYVSFLGGLAATEHHAACVSMSALLHYFLLAAFAWMAVEAVHQYLRFVRVLGTYVPGFMRKASVFAWGSALVPVVVLLSTRHDCYDAQPHVCWMDFDSFYYAFALPVLAVVAFNVIVFGLVVRSLTCGGRQKLRTNQSERQQALLRLRMAVVTFVLLGVPWLFGFLAVRQARLVFAVLFCVCNMLQGAAIFLLMVAGESGARRLWRDLVAGQCCAAEQPTSSGPDTGSGAAARPPAAPRHQDTKL